jgi:regulator of sigma E protease
LYAWGEEYLPADNVKYGVVVGETGEKLGFRNGDKILSVDHHHVEDFMKIVPTIVLEKAETVQVERDGQVLNIPITREYIANLLKNRGQIEPRTPFGPFLISAFGKESPARDAGALSGDELVGLDNIKFTWYDEFQKYLSENKNRSVMMNLVRRGEKIDLSLTVTSAGMLGIASNRTLNQIFELRTIKYGFLQSVPAGISKGFKTIGDYLKQFRLIFSKHTKAYESLGGFITIGSIFPGVWDWQSFWVLTALLSIILAVMNILPIPALDGGHVMFLLWEVITGKKPSDKFLEYAQITGMVILLSLLIFANGNDILKLLRK